MPWVKIDSWGWSYERFNHVLMSTRRLLLTFRPRKKGGIKRSKAILLPSCLTFNCMPTIPVLSSRIDNNGVFSGPSSFCILWLLCKYVQWFRRRGQWDSERDNTIDVVFTYMNGTNTFSSPWYSSLGFCAVVTLQAYWCSTKGQKSNRYSRLRRDQKCCWCQQADFRLAIVRCRQLRN